MRALLLLAAAFAITGCAAQPVPYHSGNEIPQGPGLLSGAQGEFVLRMGGASGDSAAGAAPRNADEERDYREWREERRRQGKEQP